MQSSDSLFRLIRSLSREEKRRFKLSAGLYKGRKNYLELFDAVNAQAEYDEEALKKRFGDEGMARQFHVAKNYLYNLILKSLAAAELEEETFGATLRDMLYAQALTKRSMYEEAAAVLRRGFANAERYDGWEELLLLHRMESLIDRKVAANPASAEPFHEHARKAAEIADATARRWKLLELYADVTERCLRFGFSRSEEDRAALDLLMSDPMLDRTLPLQTIEEELLALQTQWFHALAVHATEAGLEFGGRMLDLFRRFPQYCRKYPTLYASVLHNYAATSFHLGRFDVVPDIIRQLEEIDTDHQEVKYRVFANSRSLRLWYLIGIGEFAGGGDLLPELRREIAGTLFPLTIKERLFFRYQFAYISFALGRYREAWEELEGILCEFPEKVRGDLHGFVRMLSLLAQYEMGNIEGVAFGLRSLYRYLYRRNRVHRFEEAFLRYIGKLMRVRNEEERKEILREGEEAITELLSDPAEARALGYFDFAAWLQSKRTGEAFADVVRRRYEEEKREKVQGDPDII